MDIDVTYLFQLGIFLFALVALNTLILKPFLRVIQERERRTEGAQAEVELLTQQGNEAQAAYQERMRRAKIEAQKAREALKGEGRDKERQLLAEVRSEIADQLNASRKKLGDVEAATRRNLSADTDTLARQLVAKIIDRKIA